MKADRLYSSLKLKYIGQGWRTHHQDLVKYIQPRRGRFLTTDRFTSGQKKDEFINNNVATMASNTLRAGLHSGVTSSARPWFKLTTHDPALNELDVVKLWLADAERITQGVIAKSSFYLRIEELYGDVGDFGTGAFYIEQDDEEYIRCWVFPIGSYFVANGPKGTVDTIIRETSMTCDELVRKFGFENCCLQVQLAYKRADLYLDFDIVHAIVPNTGFIPGAIGTRGKKWLSLWWEAPRRPDEDFLHVGGYDYFPVMVPRWQVTGVDCYGSSPGMTALADVRALQHLEVQAMGLVDKQVNPPMNVPASMRGQQASLLPGAENYIRGPGEKMEPAVIVDPRAGQAVATEIARHEQRIRTAYFADLFRLLEMLQQQGQGQMTAYEVQQRISEKMQQLGPAYERLEEELLDPALDAIMHLCLEQFLYPPMPRELAGAEIKVEYTSIVAQAQKASVLGSVKELLALVGSIVGEDKDVLDLVDFDTVVRDYSEKLGNPPKYLRDPDVVSQMRAEKAKVMQEQQQQQQAMMQMQGAKTLADIDTTKPSALTQLLGPTGHGIG
jgi:hypothetical protein